MDKSFRVTGPSQPCNKHGKRVFHSGIREDKAQHSHDFIEGAHRKQHGAGAMTGGIGAVACHIDVDPVPAKEPPQGALADAHRLDPPRGDGLRTSLEHSVVQPHAVGGKGHSEVEVACDGLPVAGTNADKDRNPCHQDGGLPAPAHRHNSGRDHAQGKNRCTAQECRSNDSARFQCQDMCFRCLMHLPRRRGVN